MFCFDKQWIILIPVLLHFLDCNVSSHLLPSSFLLNSTLASAEALQRKWSYSTSADQPLKDPAYFPKMVPEVYCI